jgi:hypothetical protein
MDFQRATAMRFLKNFALLAWMIERDPEWFLPSHWYGREH